MAKAPGERVQEAQVRWVGEEARDGGVGGARRTRCGARRRSRGRAFPGRWRCAPRRLGIHADHAGHAVPSLYPESALGVVPHQDLQVLVGLTRISPELGSLGQTEERRVGPLPPRILHHQAPVVQIRHGRIHGEAGAEPEGVLAVLPGSSGLCEPPLLQGLPGLWEAPGPDVLLHGIQSRSRGRSRSARLGLEDTGGAREGSPEEGARHQDRGQDSGSPRPPLGGPLGRSRRQP